MPKINKNNYLIFLALIFTLFIGFLLRIYNLNFEDLWFDEMVSFWVSDPNISFLESYERNSIEGTSYFFNFILKIMHHIFGYNPHVGRYLSCSFGIFSIFSIGYLAKIIKKNNFYILAMFLISLNVFLIKYSQEIRVYSILFFLSSIILIFFFKLLNSKNNNIDISNSIYFISFQILGILAHPFAAIILFSIVLFLLIKYFKFKKTYRSLNISIFFIFLFLIFYLPLYIADTNTDLISWILHPNIKFYTNFYSSKFFGSRLVGLIHLSILIFLIIYFKNNFIKKFDKTTSLIFIIMLSYILPIFYGYLDKPIIHSRYIIFVIMPIILIISYLIFEIQNKRLKNFLISILVIFTIGNQFTETNFKQFFNERPHHKPEYSLALKKIQDSNYEKFMINFDLINKKNKSPYDPIINYFSQLIKIKNFNMQLLKKNNIKNTSNDYVWIICFQGMGNSKCNNINIDKKFTIVEDHYLNSINLKLIRLN